MPRLGDYMTTATTGFIPWCIRRICRSPVNHAAIYIGRGKVIEAQPGGARLALAANYPHAVWSTIELGVQARADIALKAVRLQGTPYSFLDIAVLWWMEATGGRGPAWARHRLTRTDRLTCGQLVDFVYRQAGVQLFHDGRLPFEVTPGDLYAITETEW